MVTKRKKVELNMFKGNHNNTLYQNQHNKNNCEMASFFFSKNDLFDFLSKQFPKTK